jgi:hypothetical protein
VDDRDGKVERTYQSARRVRRFLRTYAERPIGCSVYVVLWVAGPALLFWASRWQVWGSIAFAPFCALMLVLWALASAWLAYAWREGVFSSIRGEQLKAWQKVRKTWLAFVVMGFAKTGLVIAFGLAITIWRSWERQMAIGALMSELGRLPDERPHWVADMLSVPVTFLVWGFVSLFGWRVARKHMRRLGGQCVRCGYALRGLTEPRCPECGTPFNPADLEWLTPPSAGAEDRPGE